jgi:glycosyltransferase involved in cell wall biosynthesis
LRIAQIAPLAEAVPPSFYGGTERVVGWLTEGLVARGHDVTLYASGDSQTSARLVPCARRALRLAGIDDHSASQLAMVERVLRDAGRYDVLHFHIDLIHFPAFRPLAGKCLTTLHGRTDLPEVHAALRACPEMRLVAVSAAQRRRVAAANFAGTIHHGLPADLIGYGSGSGGYLAFIGRISPEKRPDRAIEIARRTGIRLRMAAKVDPVDRAYFEARIQPLLADPLVDYIGEIGDLEKSDFLGGARALLFPIDWPEPFGLGMIEAMAAGTPVIAWREGSTGEILEEGRSGFLVDSIDQAVAAVAKAATSSRREVRAAFEARFTADRMVDDYLRLYALVCASK